MEVCFGRKPPAPLRGQVVVLNTLQHHDSDSSLATTLRRQFPEAEVLSSAQGDALSSLSKLTDGAQQAVRGGRVALVTLSDPWQSRTSQVLDRLNADGTPYTSVLLHTSLPALLATRIDPTLAATAAVDYATLFTGHEHKQAAGVEYVSTKEVLRSLGVLHRPDHADTATMSNLVRGFVLPALTMSETSKGSWVAPRRTGYHHVVLSGKERIGLQLQRVLEEGPASLARPLRASTPPLLQLLREALPAAHPPAVCSSCLSSMQSALSGSNLASTDEASSTLGPTPDDFGEVREQLTRLETDQFMKGVRPFLHYGIKGMSAKIPGGAPYVGTCDLQGAEVIPSGHDAVFNDAFTAWHRTRMCVRHDSNQPTAVATPTGVAYIVAAFTNDLWNLDNLMQEIYRPEDVYWIHLDRLPTAKVVEVREAYKQYPNVKVSDTLKGCWGCPSLQFSYILGLMELTMMSQNWSHVTLLSASSFPIKPLSEFRDHLHSHPDKIFLDIYPAAESNTRRWAKQWDEFYFTKYKQHFVCPTEKEGPDFGNARIYKGEAWWILPYSFVQYLLCEQEAVSMVQKFMHADLPEEHMFPTMIGNSRWKDNVMPLSMLVIWKSSIPNCTPCQITKRVLPDILKAKDKFFARKFLKNDPQIIDLIRKEILHLHPSA
eukprot:NODE_751_length_2124_cov_106.984008_g716_i0.p1 GENE.NODE_751_length_2124_cov_106.984008_g716_i0~~NODE_751_length_2124_cov_106.984008_g716_i0.p1  ORF type:complete len:674 (-),score=101.57 NODE_751_length_2124_cov_106.984008_g716_i0:101-2074(-)